MIAAERLSWDAGGTRILHEVDVAMEPGTLTAVVGPNGSGKTTLLHLLAGLRTPATGRVLLDDVPLSGLRARDRARRLALLEQQPTTDLDLTVRQVVELGRIPHRGRLPGARDPDAAVVDTAMEIAGVAHLERRRWTGLSGGERQRCHLARALAQRPEVLLLDEPTNHLDLRHQIDLLRLVAGLDLTSVVVLHDLDLAAAFAPRCVVMAGGRVVAHGATESVLTAELIAHVFDVQVEVRREDRLRVLWSG